MRGGSLGDLVVSTPSPVRPRGTRSVSLFRHSPVRPATGGQRPPELRGSPAGNLGASPPVLGGWTPGGLGGFLILASTTPVGLGCLHKLVSTGRQYKSVCGTWSSSIRSPVRLAWHLVVLHILVSDKSLFTHCLALLRMLLRFTVSVRSRQSGSDVHCSEPVYVVMYSNVYIHTCASLYTYIYICPSHFMYCSSPMHIYISLHVSLPCSFNA